MSKLIATSFVFATTLMTMAGADVVAQSSSSTYLLRQQLGSDSYLWEPMLTGKRLTQQPPLINPGARARTQTPVTPAMATSPPPLTSAAQSVLNYYSSSQAAANLQQMPRQQSTTARFIPNGGRRTEPRSPNQRFAEAEANAGPVVSPYMNLFREDFDESAPNYYAFVKPQIKQQNANRRHQAEIDRLQRQLRAANSTPPPTAGHGAMPSTGRTAARFGDTGQFYGGRR